MKKITEEKLPELYSHISQNHDLFVPIDQDDSVNFSLWKDGANVNFDVLKTNTSPKKYIFPQCETFFNFKSEGKKLTIERIKSEEKPYVVFGVRPCDAKSFRLLDNVFLSEPMDRLYEEKRNRGIIVSMGCNEPEDTCFCNSFSILPNSIQEGVDVFTLKLGNKIFWEAISENGVELTNKLSDLLDDVTEGDLKEIEIAKSQVNEKVKELPFSNIDPNEINRDLNELFQSKIWDEISKSCIGCGSCTFVCPTCHCYDIQDYDGNKSGERYRCWDSCMYSEFTLMAHGNPRTTQKERFRQRFMHKLVYYPNNFDEYACVGCGRCVGKCPVNMNITKVIRKLGGENQ